MFFIQVHLILHFPCYDLGLPLYLIVYLQKRRSDQSLEAFCVDNVK